MIKEVFKKFLKDYTIEEIKFSFMTYLKEIGTVNPFMLIFDFTNILEIVFYDKNIEFACDMYDVLVPEFKEVVNDFIGGYYNEK